MNNNPSQHPVSSHPDNDCPVVLTGQLQRAWQWAGSSLRDLATSIGANHRESAAICDLFWRQSREVGVFPMAGIYGAMRWGVSRRTADRLILWLEELGHIHVAYRGDRHTPRRIRMHVVPLRLIPLEAIKRAKRDIDRRWSAIKAGLKRCAHRTIGPPIPTPIHCPIALTDDPDPAWPGPYTSDPQSTEARTASPLPPPTLSTACE